MKEHNKYDKVILEEDRFNILQNNSLINKHEKTGKTANFLYKFSKNDLVFLCLLVIIVVYYFYVFIYIFPLTEFDFNTKGNNIISKIVNNKGIIHFSFFHIFLILFLISFIRVSLSNPGYYHKEYENIYSLTKYYIDYTNYYMDICKRKADEIKDKENTLYKFRSQEVLEKLKLDANLPKENESDDSIIVDRDTRMISLNNRLKRFEEKVNVSRKSNELSKYWEINCYNYYKSMIKDNVCYYCTIIKSERVHHCKKCKSCIRRFDHHCLFVNNCIGYLNYKLFINLLFYTFILTAYVGITIIDGLVYWYNESGIALNSIVLFNIIVLCFFISALDLYYMFYHFKLLFKGLTQFEDMFFIYQSRPDYYQTIIAQSGWKKFTNVFGSNPLIWMLPIKPDIKEDTYIFK